MRSARRLVSELWSYSEAEVVRFGNWASLGEARAAYEGSRRDVTWHREHERQVKIWRYRDFVTTHSYPEFLLGYRWSGKGCPVNRKVRSWCIWVRWIQILPRIEYPESGRFVDRGWFRFSTHVCDVCCAWPSICHSCVCLSY